MVLFAGEDFETVGARVECLLGSGEIEELPVDGGEGTGTFVGKPVEATLSVFAGRVSGMVE